MVLSCLLILEKKSFNLQVLCSVVGRLHVNPDNVVCNPEFAIRVAIAQGVMAVCIKDNHQRADGYGHEHERKRTRL